MFTLTARLFQNNQLVGYQIAGNNSIKNCTKEEVWMSAKLNQIQNVTASGNRLNPQLSGTNGFELKKLPSIDINNMYPGKYKRYDAISYVLRKLISGDLDIKELDLEPSLLLSKAQSALESEISSGLIQANSLGIQSKNIFIKSRIIGENRRTLGYVIKNIGNQTIGYTRIASTLDHTTLECILEPNEEIALSTAELMVIASKPEISGKFSNAMVCIHTNNYKHAYHTLYDTLHMNFSALPSRDREAGTLMGTIKLHELGLSDEIIQKYFALNRIFTLNRAKF